MGVFCIVFAIDGMLFEFLKYWKVKSAPSLTYNAIKLKVVSPYSRLNSKLNFMFSSRFNAIFLVGGVGGGGGGGLSKIKNLFHVFFAFYAIPAFLEYYTKKSSLVGVWLLGCFFVKN